MRAGWLAGLLFFCLPLFCLPLAASPRVVSLAPFLTDMAVQLGAVDQLVGVLDDGQLPAVLDAVPRVGSHQSLSRELILAQQPDLVLAWTSGNPPDLLSALESWGIRVERFDPQRLADISQMTLQLGELLNANAAADTLLADFQDQLAMLRRPLTEDAPKVFIQLWNDPLYTVSNNQLIGDALQHCGARNVFASLPILAPQVGRESVLAADPDVIVVLDDSAADQHPWLQQWRQFPQMKAVRGDGLKVLDGESLVRPTPAIINGLQTLCALVEGSR
ncbi:cobalamin-binding protein [Halopseudomonas pelagia]|uniref:cobalamin-binding protein n=1 Tax=Halopseudomonas pelagia TaxID=553151 RepID=UPI0030D78288|tara:strand:+ start:31820 stop:32647 length:828 start_codon:yes stop_codon:yes gene_type:complete